MRAEPHWQERAGKLYSATLTSLLNTVPEIARLLGFE